MGAWHGMGAGGGLGTRGPHTLLGHPAASCRLDGSTVRASVTPHGGWWGGRVRLHGAVARWQGSVAWRSGTVAGLGHLALLLKLGTLLCTPGPEVHERGACHPPTHHEQGACHPPPTHHQRGACHSPPAATRGRTQGQPRMLPTSPLPTPLPCVTSPPPYLALFHVQHRDIPGGTPMPSYAHPISRGAG